MDHSLTFAQHFARLVWLLLNQGDAIDEQKGALRSALLAARDGAVTLATKDWRLYANGEPVPETLTGVQDLTAQLVGHALHELQIDQAALPPDVLGVARILAGEPMPGSAGKAFADKLASLDAKTVRATAEIPVEIPRPSQSTPRMTVGIDAVSLTPPTGGDAIQPTPPVGMPTIGGEDDSGMYLTFSAVQATKGSVGDLLAQLDATKNVNVTTRLLDELVTLTETSQREGKLEVVGDSFYGIVTRENTAEPADLKRAYVMAIRRMSKPTLLRAVAQLLPRKPEKDAAVMAVIVRAGEDGADALIEQLVGSQTVTDRRVYFNALVKLNAGITALIHMLNDTRWYVVRNAAELLGDMGANEGETPLIDTLKHDDDRVRRAVSVALAKLGTPKAVDALRKMLKDAAPQVRLQAAIGLAALKGAKTATTITMALDEEQDQEVQLALLAALGKLATPDAVQKLIKAAEPETRLFKRKASAYRIAAVQALGEARTPAALTALQTFLQDKDKEVRDTVFRITMLAPRPTGEHTPVASDAVGRPSTEMKKS
jgi:hypothetical protein